MNACIKSVDKKEWMAILTGWDHAMMKNDKDESVKNLEVQWTADKDRLG